MDELVKMVAEKTGLSNEMAKTAVDTVVGFLKDKLPAPIANQIDSVLGGEVETDLGGIAQTLGGVLGKND